MMSPCYSDAFRFSHVSFTLRRISRFCSHSHRFLSPFQYNTCVRRHTFFNSCFRLSSFQKCLSFSLHLIYRVSQEEWTKLRENVPYVELYRYNPKHLFPKLNGYGDNGHRKVWASGVSTYCKPSVTPYSSNAHARQRDTTS